MRTSPGKLRACAPTQQSRKRQRPAQLQVEQLEARNLPSVYSPAQISQAYGFNQVTFTTTTGQTVQGNGSGQTIAIVDAYAAPNLVNDLNTFDQTFTTTKNGVSGTYYNLYGASSNFLTVATPGGQPATNAGWALEITLDVEWAHAMAPGAKILLVEAPTSSLNDLLGAVSYAAAQPGVVAVSMSWGSPEFAGETSYDSYFTTPANHLGGSNGLGGGYLPGGITFVAASGDSGAGPSYPAVSPNVLSVGGTALTLSSSGGYGSETAWSGSGGGYSLYEKAPSYQGTGMRSNPDVAYNADPYTGYWVYDSLGYGGYSGWLQVGGTSAAAPQWAALVAIADQGRAIAGKGSLDGASQTLPTIYSLPASDFHDITTGSNGYAAGPGYDLVTGRGSPIANLVIPGLAGVSGSGSTTSGGGTSGGGTSHKHHSVSHADSLPTQLPASAITPSSSDVAAPIVVSAPAGRLPAPVTVGLSSAIVTPVTIPTVVAGSGGDIGEVGSLPLSLNSCSRGKPGGPSLAEVGFSPAFPQVPSEGAVELPVALDAWFAGDTRDREGPDAAEVAAAPVLAGERSSLTRPAALSAAVAVALAGYWAPPVAVQKPRRPRTMQESGQQ
jgi:subtilase family serine protease